MVAPLTPPDPLLAALREFAPRSARSEARFDAAVRQAVELPGKLVRARLARAGALAHGMDADAALQLACAVEYFHTASLLLDDLPCMDDAATRRGLPCAHRAHGEAAAILASLALINRAYALIGFAYADRSFATRIRVQACVDACLGPAGLVGGQAADLRFGEGPGGAAEVGRIAAAKTGALFWLAVYLPALAGEPDAAELKDFKALCVYWGLAFQAMDDLADLARGEAEAGKTTGRDRALARPNLVLAVGERAARARVDRLGRLAGQAVARLEARVPERSYLRRFHEQFFVVAREVKAEASRALVAA